MNQKDIFKIDARYFSLGKLILSADLSENAEIGYLNYEDYLTPVVLKEEHEKDSITTLVLVKDDYKILKIGNQNGLLSNKMVIESSIITFPGNDTNKMEFWLNERSISGIGSDGKLSFTIIRFREIYAQFLRVEFERDYFCKIIEICNDLKGDKVKQNMDKDHFQAPKANISDISRNSAAEELSKNAREKLFGKNENKDEISESSKRLYKDIAEQWRPKIVKESLDLESNDFLESLSNSSQNSVVAYYPLNDFEFKKGEIFYQKMRPVGEQQLLKQLINISKHYFPKEIFQKELLK